jgi:hypothetical protein
MQPGSGPVCECSLESLWALPKGWDTAWGLEFQSPERWPRGAQESG